MRVLILHTLAPDAPAPGRSRDEFDLSAAAQNIHSAVPQAVVVGVRGEVGEIMRMIGDHRPDVVFNACEAPLGRVDREFHVATLLEWLGIRFTGSGSETLALCRRKDRTSAVLAAAGILVPRTGIYPCMVKPAAEDGSAGISADCICSSPEQVERARQRLVGPSLVQEFLPGREFAVSLWGKDRPEHISIGETLYQNGLALITYAAKWETQSPDFANSPLSYSHPLEPTLREQICEVASGTWQVVEARGYLRMDIRLDREGLPRVMDVNPNPELGPDVGICRAVREAGWTWEQFVRKQIEWSR